MFIFVLNEHEAYYPVRNLNSLWCFFHLDENDAGRYVFFDHNKQNTEHSSQHARLWFFAGVCFPIVTKIIEWKQRLRGGTFFAHSSSYINILRFIQKQKSFRTLLKIGQKKTVKNSIRYEASLFFFYIINISMCRTYPPFTNCDSFVTMSSPTLLVDLIIKNLIRVNSLNPLVALIKKKSLWWENKNVYKKSSVETDMRWFFFLKQNDRS